MISFHCFTDFSGIISKAAIKVLAEADENEVVREIQEYYVDYFAVGPSLFSFNIEKPIIGMEWDPSSLLRTTQGISSTLLALKKCPIIRFQSFSGLARKLADNIRVRRLNCQTMNLKQLDYISIHI